MGSVKPVFPVKKPAAPRVLQKCWKKPMKRAAEMVTGVINGKVKGGFTVDLNEVRAFLPGSLVDVRPIREPDSP